jgi:hypothetical protein
MSRLMFKAADLLRVVAHSLAAPAQSEHVIDYRKGKAITALPEAPAVLLVHDEGVYLMSNGFPADPLERKATGRHFRRYVAYAQGCDPRTDKGWYEPPMIWSAAMTSASACHGPQRSSGTSRQARSTSSSK